jgi:hypothetical protein
VTESRNVDPLMFLVGDDTSSVKECCGRETRMEEGIEKEG